MADETKPPAHAEHDADQFPRQMLLVRDVFGFSFDEATHVARRFSNNGEMFDAIRSVVDFLPTSGLPAEDVATLEALLKQEIEVMSYSQVTRCSVISL